MNFGNGALPVPVPWTQNPCRPWERLGAPVSLSDRYGNVIVGASAPSSRCCPDSRWCGRMSSASNTGKTFSEAFMRRLSVLDPIGLRVTSRRQRGRPMGRGRNHDRPWTCRVTPKPGGLPPAQPPSGPQAHAADHAPWAATLRSATALPHSGTAPRATAVSHQMTPSRAP